MSYPRFKLLEGNEDLEWDFVRFVLDYDYDTGELIWNFDWGWGAAGAVAGRVRKDGGKQYRYVGIENKRRPAHHVVWFWLTGSWPPLIDHKDSDGLNNRWRNLRKASHRMNSENRRHASKNSRSGFLGVQVEGSRFKASIKSHGKVTVLGHFDEASPAYEAYVQAKRILHEGCTL